MLRGKAMTHSSVCSTIVESLARTHILVITDFFGEQIKAPDAQVSSREELRREWRLMCSGCRDFTSPVPPAPAGMFHEHSTALSIKTTFSQLVAILRSSERNVAASVMAGWSGICSLGSQSRLIQRRFGCTP